MRRNVKNAISATKFVRWATSLYLQRDVRFVLFAKADQVASYPTVAEHIFLFSSLLLLVSYLSWPKSKGITASIYGRKGDA
jgi:hypothetical protein